MQISLHSNFLESDDHGLDRPIFTTRNFNSLHSSSKPEVIDLVFEREGIPLLSLIVRKDMSTITSPVSAPFGGFTELKSPLSIDEYIDAANTLTRYVREQQLLVCSITLPPSFYNHENIRKQMFALLSAGFQLKHTDVNYSLRLEGSLQSKMQGIAKRSLKKARKYDLEFSRCRDQSGQEIAYRTIEMNREQNGYQLKLSHDEIRRVEALCCVDYFVVEHKSSVVAAAIVYQASTEVAQVIYWGHNREYDSLCSIHFLADNLFNYYHGKFLHLDIGPSSEGGVANTSLCRFKESLGCDTTLKHSLCYRSPDGIN